MREERKSKVQSSKFKVAALSVFALCTLNFELAAAQDTLRLPVLQEAAERQDPRARQLAVREEALGLRLRNLAAERLPQLLVGTQATHQSEVPGIPIALPNVEPPTPPKDRYDATLSVEQRIFDPTTAGREEVERARLSVERAELGAALYPLRMEVSEAFFTAFLLQERRGEVLALATDLEARLALVRARVREGAALRGDTATLRAELLGVAQQLAEVDASRAAALSLLSDLTGREIAESDQLALPDLSASVVAAGEAEALRAHPQYAVLAARRESLRRESALVQAQTRPRVSAFGELGYGRPGPKQFTKELHEYWSAGVRLSWTPWSWGTTARQQSILELEARVVDTEEAALAARLERQVEGDVQTMARLRATLAADEQIIALREQVERQAAAQLAERAIPPAEYVDVRTDLQEARLARQRHRVELARAEAHYLITLGIELPR
jgi:outer membrane protein TolC